MNTRACTRCRAQTEPDLLPSAAGQADPVALTLRDMPVLTCPQGHRQFLDTRFARRLVDHLVNEDEARLPAGRKKGLVFKHYHCGGCGAELARQADRNETFPFEVALPEAPPFRVELTLPVFRCPQCGQQQLHSLEDVRSRTPEALAAAFRAAQIPPA